MGKKGKRNKYDLPGESQQPPSLTPSSSSHPLLRLGKNKVASENIADSEIPFSGMSLHPDDKGGLCCIKEKGETAMTNDHSLLEKLCECEDAGEMEEQQESRSEKASKRKQKKERQREKKLARKMAANKRRQSELSLESDFLDNDDQTNVSVIEDSKAVKISLCRHPLTTLEYFAREIPCILFDVKKRCAASRQRRNNDGLAGVRDTLLIVFIVLVVLSLTYLWIAMTSPLSLQIKQYISWYFYWIFLGILSSVGLGTGLHTFILYLGPFIAKVSLAAQECYTLDFPQPPYPTQVICPSESQEGHHETPSIWAISTKVRWETLAWGFGTALGELPPYFVARAASLADKESNSDDLENQDGFLAKVQLKMRDFVMKVGFWGILICASIPNPLFDLAGITCGHFQVPFLIFFGATAIGKTIVKSQLQMIFVILAFNENSLERALKSLGSIPKVGMSLRKAFTDFMDYQRAALHNQDTSQSGGILKLVTEIIVLVMILYFIGSIISGMARSYQKRIAAKNMKGEKKSNKPRKRLKSLT